MIVCYLRSSSIGTLSFCEQKYFLSYVLGFKDKTNKKAVMGSIMHKALEILGLSKIAQTKNESKVNIDDIGILSVNQCNNIDLITTKAFEFYQRNTPELNFTTEDLNTCIKWVNKAIQYNEGSMDPRNQNIKAVEVFFDIEIQKDWAWYEYKTGNQEINGFLSLKGTIDVLVDEGDIYHLQDYKSGRRLNWSTDKEKSYECLQKDDQLLLYYYVMKNLYPDKEFHISIFYVNDGGVYTFPFDKKDYEKAERMIRQKFEYIKDTKYPKLLSNDNSHWKCQYLCAFSQPFDYTEKSICHHIRDEIKLKGIDKVTREYADFDKIVKYGDGGGRLQK